MATLAAATPEELRAGVDAFTELGAVENVRPPDIGLVMLRGRIGGEGAPFNFGEATVARATVRLGTGEVGYGLRLGRNRDAARDAAILDAMFQAPARRDAVKSRVLQPISRRVAADRARRSSEAAATRVNFFTLAREAT